MITTMIIELQGSASACWWL